MYTLSIQRNEDEIQRNAYYTTWEANLAYAIIKEKEEFNERTNTSWKFMSNNDPRKLWKLIDYNDKGMKAATTTQESSGESTNEKDNDGPGQFCRRRSCFGFPIVSLWFAIGLL